MSMPACESNIFVLIWAKPGIARSSLTFFGTLRLSHFKVTGHIFEFSDVGSISCAHIQTIVCLL